MKNLIDKKLIHPPNWLCDNTCLLTTMGSIAYGVSQDASDFDVYGVCIPTRETLFPHLAGEIWGFGKYKEGMPQSHFQQWQQHHVFDADAVGGKGREYDFTIFNIVKYFQLVMENNPNCLDSLFTREEYVLHCTQVGTLIRENRKIFLHKGCWQKFKGYAMSMLHKIDTKKHEGYDELLEFENKHNISNSTTFEMVELEMKKRNLL